MTTPLLEVRDLAVTYGAVAAVRSVSVRLDAGQVLAVLGANGAGKTSLLRGITGLEPLARGDVLVDGTSVAARRPEQIARLGVAHVPDHRGLFPSLTVAENLRMGLYGAGRDGTDEGHAALDEVLEMFPILRERRTQPAGNLSGGQQQMLTIGRALLQGPRLLLLDEMSMGLAPSIVEELFEVVGRLAAEGIAVVLVEQFVGQALAVADQVLLLEQGRTVANGTPAQLAQHDLAAAYLGGEEEVDLGQLPPAPDFATAEVTARVDARRMRRLDQLARQRGVAVSELVGTAVDRLVEEEQP